MCTPEEQNHLILRYKHFFLGHFWFALIEFASFSPFNRVSSFLFSFFIRFKIVTNIAKKINSSNPLCLFLTITFLRFPWNPAVKNRDLKTPTMQFRVVVCTFALFPRIFMYTPEICSIRKLEQWSIKLCFNKVIVLCEDWKILKPKEY